MASYKISGEGLTNIIRQTWAEGRLSVALDICEDSGAPQETHIDICTGKQKILGVGDLWLEKDTMTEYCGFDITLESTINRLEEKYVKLHIQFANAELRMRYFTLRCDFDGITYRNPSGAEKFMYSDVGVSTYDKDQVIINRVGRELAELEPLFSILYPLVGKTSKDIPYHRFLDEEIFEPDLEHPYYLPNLRKNKNEIIEKDIEGKETIIGGIVVFPKKSIEIDQTEKGKLPNLSDYKVREFRPISPDGIDDPYIENAWIARNGDFYGDMRMSIGSVFVHIEMAERLSANGIIPKTPISPEKYMEESGWIKLSNNEVHYYPKSEKTDYSSAQIKTLILYAKVRGLLEITIGSFGTKVKIEDLGKLTYNRKF
jgi:hypothetical protein